MPTNHPGEGVQVMTPPSIDENRIVKWNSKGYHRVHMVAQSPLERLLFHHLFRRRSQVAETLEAQTLVLQTPQYWRELKGELVESTFVQI